MKPDSAIERAVTHTDLARRAGIEVIDLHRFFNAWFNGAIPKTGSEFDRVRQVWPERLTMIAPDNSILAAAQLLDATYAQHGAFPGLSIRIENLRISAPEGSAVAVALYEEWHVDEHETEVRLCSATLVESGSAPNGVRWLHIHEAGLRPTPVSAQAEALTVTTSRGAKLQAVADFPVGPGPFPAVVLAPGQGYHMARPALEQTARRLVSQGVAVYRFNWAYYSADPKTGSPSQDLADELQDLTAVLAAAAAEPRVSPGRLSVGGKSLGSVLAWRALAADKSLRSGLFLTPICSHVLKGKSVPDSVADENYSGLATEDRPLLFISGDQDPLCAPAVLYRFAASSSGSARVAIVGGDHSYENRAFTGATADEVRTRNIDSVARLAADFIVEASGTQEVVGRGKPVSKSVPVPEVELAATVARMEARLGSTKVEAVERLMAHYGALARRFETDLAVSSREVLLAKASALMLVQAVAGAQDAD